MGYSCNPYKDLKGYKVAQTGFKPYKELTWLFELRAQDEVILGKFTIGSFCCSI